MNSFDSLMIILLLVVNFTEAGKDFALAYPVVSTILHVYSGVVLFFIVESILAIIEGGL